MGTFRIASALNALAIIAAVTAIPSQAQPAQTVQAALSKEAGTLSDKFTGLARVMTGKYDWRPGQGVRSVGEVFNLIVTENGILARTLTGATAGAKSAQLGPSRQTFSHPVEHRFIGPTADPTKAIRGTARLDRADPAGLAVAVVD